MKFYNSIALMAAAIFILFGCSSQRSVITNPKADIISSLEEISEHKNNKAEIARKLPDKLGNMELFKVADFSKRYISGIDLGYGIYYDLKNNKKGSGNIFLYKRYENTVEDGLTDGLISELLIERRDIENSETVDSTYSIANFGTLEFYRMSFITPPDKNNDRFDCYLFITGYNGVYLKVLFYFPMNSDFGEKEAGFFMNSLAQTIVMLT